jgi:phage terminase small subunit
MALTIKQENFCQAYIRLGDKSAAYREAYNASKMKNESVNSLASRLFENVHITSRVEFLQKEALERNNITVDELIKTMASMVRFDLSEMYDENGKLKHIHDIPKEARQMISQIDVFEEFEMVKGEKVLIGYTKKVRTFNKLDAVEKLMKHLGGYKEDNKQRSQQNTSVKVEFVDFTEDKKDNIKTNLENK